MFKPNYSSVQVMQQRLASRYAGISVPMPATVPELLGMQHGNMDYSKMSYEEVVESMNPTEKAILQRFLVEHAEEMANVRKERVAELTKKAVAETERRKEVFDQFCRDNVRSAHGQCVLYSVIFGILETYYYKLSELITQQRFDKADKFRYARDISCLKEAMKAASKESHRFAIRMNVPIFGNILAAYALEYEENDMQSLIQHSTFQLDKAPLHKIYTKTLSKVQSIHIEWNKRRTLDQKWGKNAVEYKPVAFPNIVSHLFFIMNTAQCLEVNVKGYNQGTQMHYNHMGMTAPNEMLIDARPLAHVREHIRSILTKCLGQYFIELDREADPALLPMSNIMKNSLGKFDTMVKDCHRKATHSAFDWYVSRLIYSRLREEKVPDKVKEDINLLLDNKCGWLSLMKDVKSLVNTIAAEHIPQWLDSNAPDKSRAKLLKPDKGRTYNANTVSLINDVILDLHDDDRLPPTVMKIHAALDDICDERKIVNCFTLLQHNKYNPK